MTGPLADPLDRDLRCDGIEFDSLGWRGLWAYVTCAPPGTAIHQVLSEGWSLGDKLAAEQIYAAQELNWRYTAVHFKDGNKVPFPERIAYPGAPRNVDVDVKKAWETVTLDELVSPEVRAMMRGA